MRIVKFDQQTYDRTKNLPGMPIYGFVEEEISEIELVCDEDGNPTTASVIAYYLSIGVIVALLLYFFFAV